MHVSQVSRCSVALVCAWIVTSVPGWTADLRANGLSDAPVTLTGATKSSQVQVTSSGAASQVSFIVAINEIEPGVPWLDAQQSGGPYTTPATVTLTATSDLAGFGAGPFRATIVIVPLSGDGVGATVHVTYSPMQGSNPGGTNPGGTNPGGTNPGGTNPGGTNPGGSGLRVGSTTAAVSYNISTGGSQTASIAVSGAATYGAAASTENGIKWLALSDGVRSGATLANVTAQTLTVTVGPEVSQLIAGTYKGTVVLTSSDNSQQTVAITLVVTAPASANPGALTVRYQVVKLGGNSYRYVYYLSGYTFQANQELDMKFDPDVYGNLLVPSGGDGFNVLVEQPNNPPGAPGHYSARAMTSSPTMTGRFSVDMQYLGSGQPGKQPFVINQLDANGAIKVPPSPIMSGVTLTLSPADPQQPLISAIVPNTVTPDKLASVLLVGANFQNGLKVAVTTSAGAVATSGLSVSSGEVRFQMTMSGTSPATPYIANVTVTNPGGLSATTTFLVNVEPPKPPAPVTGKLRIDPTTLEFSAQAGSSNTSREVTISNESGTAVLKYTVAASAPWLKASTLSGSTPSKLTVSADPTGLSPGRYKGAVTVTPTGDAAAIIVAVTFIVQEPPAISTPLTELTFFFRPGASALASQTVSISGSAAGAAFKAQGSKDSAWLAVSPASGVAPADLSVTVDPTGLSPDTYTGTITVSGVAGTIGLAVINVRLTVKPVLPTIDLVVNAASLQSGAIAPGEIITITGSDIGPALTVNAQIGSSAKVATQLSDVQVLVNNFPAPVISATSTQVTAVVPYELDGFDTATVMVRYLGQTSNARYVPVAASAPGIFTVNQAGNGPTGFSGSHVQVVPTNPLSKGEQVILYLTGEGQTSPSGTTGVVNPTTPGELPTPLLRPTVLVDGKPAEWTYAGGAPGMVAGMMQLNVKVPETARSGDVPIVVTFGSNSTQQGVTVSVR